MENQMHELTIASDITEISKVKCVKDFQVPRKRNIRKVPLWLMEKIQNLPKDEFIVGCVKKISSADLALDKYSHLRYLVDREDFNSPQHQLPTISMGRFSRLNVEGSVVIRKDLPKVIKLYSWESPNFGDWSKGSHTVGMSREVYQRDFKSPKEITIGVEVLEAEDQGRGET